MQLKLVSKQRREGSANVLVFTREKKCLLVMKEMLHFLVSASP